MQGNLPFVQNTLTIGGKLAAGCRSHVVGTAFPDPHNKGSRIRYPFPAKSHLLPPGQTLGLARPATDRKKRALSNEKALTPGIIPNS